jgi:hypothetical protein
MDRAKEPRFAPGFEPERRFLHCLLYQTASEPALSIAAAATTNPMKNPAPKC